MRYINAMLIIMLSQCLLFGEEKAYVDAASLASKLIVKLNENTPFTLKDGEKFFGPIASIPTLNIFLLQKLGYLDESGNPVKNLPKYSPLGELLRMNRGLFISDGEINQILFLPAKALRKGKDTDEFTIHGKNKIFVYIKMDYKKNDIEYINEKLLRFDYNVIGKFFFVYDFTVDGKSILEKLGFYSKKHDKYNYPVIEIKDDVFTKLKMHLEE